MHTMLFFFSFYAHSCFRESPRLYSLDFARRSTVNNRRCRCDNEADSRKECIVLRIRVSLHSHFTILREVLWSLQSLLSLSGEFCTFVKSLYAKVWSLFTTVWHCFIKYSAREPLNFWFSLNFPCVGCSHLWTIACCTWKFFKVS